MSDAGRHAKTDDLFGCVVLAKLFEELIGDVMTRDALGQKNGQVLGARERLRVYLLLEDGPLDRCHLAAHGSGTVGRGNRAGATPMVLAVPTHADLHFLFQDFPGYVFDKTH